MLKFTAVHNATFLERNEAGVGQTAGLNDLTRRDGALFFT
jgi:hypothetical protein